MNPATPRRKRPPPRPQSILLGPILHARGIGGATGSAARWRVAITFLLERDQEPPDLLVEGVMLPVPPRFLYAWNNMPPVGPDLADAHAQPCPTGPMQLWRYDFAVPRGLQDGHAAYGFQGEERRWRFTVPGTAMTPRIAYNACGGCEDESTIQAEGLSRNAMWGHLLGRHRTNPFHLMLMGGDQVYADGLWEQVPGLKEVASRPLMRRVDAKEPPELETELDAWYLATYRHAWNQPEAAAMLASVPGLRMWDDHDIVDGWGSHPESLLQSPVYQAIYRAARRAFRLFQIGMTDDDPVETLMAREPPGFTQGIMVNGIGILAPDLRSERRPDQVFSLRSLRHLPRWLEHFSACGHLLVMSSVPLVFPSFGLLERMLNLIPGRQKMEDDLRDQWRSPAHTQEWLQVVEALLDFSRRQNCAVTILSGEVHLGANGRIDSGDVTLHQCVSSGIVHPAPKGFAVEIMERMAAKPEKLRSGMRLTMEPMPGQERRLLTVRNWLSVTGADDGGLLAEWYGEGMATPLALSIPARRRD